MSDLIDRQAAIDEAEEWIDAVYCDHDEQRERDAIRHVINGIKELPSVQPYCEADIQKMQDLEQAEIQKAYELGKLDAEQQWIPCSERQPTISTERKTGKWIYKNDLKQFFCDQCGEPSLTDDDVYIYSMDFPNFCPNCGADTRGESDETD